MRREQEEYTMKKTYALALFGLLFCNRLSLFAVSTSTDYDHSSSFSQYKTFSWLKVQAGELTRHGRSAPASS
jgi:hypothetical protein